MILGSKEIRARIIADNLIAGYTDLDKQLQPAGFDLTLKNIAQSRGLRYIGRTTRTLPATEPMITMTSVDNPIPRWHIEKGAYIAFFNEIVKLPRDIAAIHTQSSSLMRCGVTSATGIWDPGYCGSGQTLLTVGAPTTIEQNARICQMVFFSVVGADHEYSGVYQGEGSGRRIGPPPNCPARPLPGSPTTRGMPMCDLG